MGHPDFEYKLMLERHRNDLATAEHSRLVKMAIEAQKENRAAGNGFYPGSIFQSGLNLAGQGLYLLGMRFQGWGCQLQVRYATASRSSSNAPCE
jgi:hypothetical protein